MLMLVQETWVLLAYLIYVICDSGLDSCNVSLPSLQLKIQNDFDPVLSPESSPFVLKSTKQVIYAALYGTLHVSTS
jgi:hypothetical protein